MLWSCNFFCFLYRLCQNTYTEAQFFVYKFVPLG